MGKNDMEESGERECEESRVKNRGSCRSNEMEGRCESDCGGDEVYPATFGNKKKTGLKLDRKKNSRSFIFKHKFLRKIREEQKKSHHIRKSPIFHANSSEEQKIITSANIPIKHILMG